MTTRVRRSSLNVLSPNSLPNPFRGGTGSNAPSPTGSPTVQPQTMPTKGGRARRTSLQLQPTLLKVKKETVTTLTRKVYANPNEQDNKGITPLMQLECIILYYTILDYTTL